MIKKLIIWLYGKYVLAPMAKRHGAKSITQEFYIDFDPDPVLDAQIEKDATQPRVH